MRSGWLRGVAYHESVAGPLDRDRLDAWVADRPLRVQHRSGALWMLNSAGIPAFVLHERAGFSCTWFEHSTPVRAVSQVMLTAGDVVPAD